MNYTASADRYSHLPYRRCGTNGILLPAISLGLWHNFGEPDKESVFKEILFKAFDKGITYFDLANNYGPPFGAAEENFGKILHRDMKPYRDQMIISTKAGYKMWDGPYGEWGSRKYMLASLDQSLKRMQLDYVDIFYSHRFDPNTPLEETMGALAQAVRQGKALYAGISNYPPQQTRQASEILSQMGTPCLIHQVKYSMLVRTPEEGLLEVLKEKGIGCVAFSPLAQGLLTDRYLNGIPKDSRAEKSHGYLQKETLTDEMINKIKALNLIALQRGQSLASMALSWLLKDKTVSSVLIGASSVDQLENSLTAVESIDFSEEELQKIEMILSA